MLRKKLISVGSDIVHFCKPCNLELGHTILAMIGSEPARVRCNTCRGERNFRKPRPKIERKSEPRKRTGVSAPGLYQQKLKDSLMKTPKDYRIDISFEDGDVINHKTFGKGIVLKVIPPDRVEVIFQDQTRVLVCKV